MVMLGGGGRAGRGLMEASGVPGMFHSLTWRWGVCVVVTAWGCTPSVDYCIVHLTLGHFFFLNNIPWESFHIRHTELFHSLEWLLSIPC